MELTINLPVGEWYRGAAPGNDLQYWGTRSSVLSSSRARGPHADAGRRQALTTHH